MLVGGSDPHLVGCKALPCAVTVGLVEGRVGFLMAGYLAQGGSALLLVCWWVGKPLALIS